MRLIEIGRNPSPSQLRQFGSIWLPLLLALVGWFALRRSVSWTPVIALWAIGVLIALIALVRPVALRSLFVGWMIVTYPIGAALTTVILALIYFAVITPMGTVMRWAGRNPMSREAGASTGTYWIRHDPGGDAARYFRQY